MILCPLPEPRFTSMRCWGSNWTLIDCRYLATKSSPSVSFPYTSDVNLAILFGQSVALKLIHLPRMGEERRQWDSIVLEATHGKAAARVVGKAHRIGQVSEQEKRQCVVTIGR